MIQEVPHEIRVSPGNGVRVLRLTGVVGRSALPRLREAALDLLAMGMPVRVDCRDVLDLSPEAISMLVALKAGLALQEQEFAIDSLDPEIVQYVGDEAEALIAA